MPARPARGRVPSAALAMLCALCGCAGSGGAPRVTPTPTAAATATSTRAASATPSASAVATATASATGTATASATPTGTVPPSATASATPTATDNPLRLPALHAAPDPVGGGRIVDAEGREVLLRGVNVNALVDYWQGGEFSTVFPVPESDIELMAAIGWNAVRLLLSWSRVEPQPGVYDDAYLADAAVLVRQLASRGLYSIIDLHQDAWGATLAAPPGTECPMGSSAAFGWDGAPGWATLDADMSRCAQLGVRELSPAVRAAFTAFFADAAGPGGVGIRSRYVAMLAHVAGTFATVPGVAGYDLMNEPNAFGVEENAALSALYAAALPAIRDAEHVAGGGALVFFEPSALWSLTGNGPPPPFDHDRDIVYAPHVYAGSLSVAPLAPASFQVARDEAALFGGAPVVSGEWGSDPRQAADPSDPFFAEHQRLQDAFRFGATLWTWHESCGDPHKQADLRAGRVPYVWGEFDVDCTTNTITGVRTPLVRALTRAYVRAAPGRLLDTEYDPATGAFSAHGAEATSGAQLVAFYPASLHGTPALTGSGLDDLQMLPAPGDNLYVLGRAVGGAWMLQTE